MLMNSKNLILKNIIDTEPVLGAGAPDNSKVVRFAFTSNPESIASGADGQIVFAHIPALGNGDSTGVIYVGDQIVSSKILDASFVDVAIEGETGKYLYTDGLYYADGDANIPAGAKKVAKQTFTVKYVDVANHVVNASFDNVNPELAQAFVRAQAAADAERLNDLDASVTEIKTFVKSDTVVTAADNASNAVIVNHSDDANGYTSYTVDVKVDDKTIKIDGTTKAIKAPKTIDVSAGGTGEEGKNFIVLKNAAGEIESSIDVASIIGNGIVTSATYNPADNKLTIVWNTATGDASTVIDLGALLDINDVFVASDSEDYLGVTLSSSTMTLAAKVQDISTADKDNTGLLDASTTKTWVLDRLQGTTISAQGDDYISATIDANDNKKIIIDSSVATLTYNATTTGDNPTNATLVGVANSLVDGAQAAEAISNFVNDRIDASIKALDAEQGGKDVNVSVGVTEVDGKITNVSVVETYATVTYREPQTGETPSPASLVVTEGTEGGLVTGADINKVKQYVDAQLGAADADVTVKEANTEYVAVTIAERNGVLSTADSSLSVTYAQYGADSSGIATDEYVTAAIQALDLASTAAGASAHDASSLVTVTISETDGIVNMESVAVKTIDVSSASADSDGLATAKAVKDALTWSIIS